MVSTDIDRTLLSVKQAVTDLRALILWLKANSRGKVIKNIKPYAVRRRTEKGVPMSMI